LLFCTTAASTETTESSPYYETFKKNDIECLFVYNTIDDFVMSNLSEYNGRKIVSAEKDDFDLGTTKTDDASENKVKNSI
jgi:TNF receptor-associated protein 1